MTTVGKHDPELGVRRWVSISLLQSRRAAMGAAGVAPVRPAVCAMSGSAMSAHVGFVTATGTCGSSEQH